MSENRNNSRTTVRNLKKTLHTTRIWVVILIIVALLLAGHVAWCLMHHMDGEAVLVQHCTVCGQQESSCTCAAEFSTLRAQIETLEEDKKLLQSENDFLRTQILEKDTDDDGQCHSACPVHCPQEEQCEHAFYSWVEGAWEWAPIGTKSTCRKGTCVAEKVCSSCGAVLDTEIRTKVDYTHCFGGDTICDDCGYEKPTTVIHTKEPTVDPIIPTATPITPTATPTPTAAPTPTAIPTPTECPHSHTQVVTGEWSWVTVGKANTCCKATRTVKTMCADCGKEIATVTETKTNSEHEFKKRDCTICGYKKPATSGAGTAEGNVPESNNSWTIEDDSEIPSPVEPTVEEAVSSDETVVEEGTTE